MSSDPLSRYSVSGSSIERILSRYRPIAPKPTNTSCTSTVSASASMSTELLLQPAAVLPKRATTGSGKRKRAAELAAATDMCQSSKKSECSSAGVGGHRRSVSNPTNPGLFYANNNNNNNNNDDISNNNIKKYNYNYGPAISSPDFFMHTAAQTCAKYDSGGSALEKPSLRSSWCSSSNNNNNNINNNHNHHNNSNNNSNNNSSSNSNNNNNNNNNHGVGKGFFNMIRGITCLPSTADVHALLTPRISTNTVPNMINQELLSVCSNNSDINNHNNDIINSSNNDNNNNNPVTLSLFPETPLPAPPLKPAKTAPNAKPFSGSPTLIEKPQDVERAYGSSSDPVLLVGDNGVVVWMNAAYEKSHRSAMDRPISSSSVYIDPLGIPTQLAEFRLASSGNILTLWGFLKRLVGIGAADDQSLAVSSYHNGGVKETTGFSLSLERITEVRSSSSSISSLSSLAHLQASILQEAQLHVSSLSCPAFITEASKQQKLVWMNPAFEKTVDRISRQAGDNTKATADGGIIYSTASYHVNGVTIPASVSSFSGCLNLQWISADSRREKHTMTVPCDAVRVGGRKREIDEVGLFIWKLDVAASLGLCC